MRNSITAAVIIAFAAASGAAANAGTTTVLVPATVTVVHGCKHADDHKSKSNEKTTGEDRQENRGDGDGCGTIKTESFTLTFSFLSGVHVQPVISKDGKSGTTIDF